MIEIKTLKIQFPSNKRLNIGNIIIAEKGSFLIFGGNGSGKTTLVRCILGLYQDYKGSILLDGRDAKSLGRKEIAAFISYLPQTGGADTDFTVEDFIRQGLYAVQNDYMDEVVDILRLKPYLKRRYSELSGGEKQLSRIARAMAADVKYSFLDEPDAFLSKKKQGASV